MAVKIDISSVSAIGSIVQFHRKQAGLTRIALADIAGVGKTVIYDIERGKETIRINTLLKILNALNVSISLDGPLMKHYEAENHAES